MSETILNYDNTNKYLPDTLRQFVGANDRMMRQDFTLFEAMYDGIEKQAVFNNRIAAEYASGFTRLNYVYLRSGVAPKLVDIITSKAVDRVWYQAAEENEVVFDNYLNRNYFSDMLYKGFEEAAITARSIMVVYPKKNDIEIATYNLFRHRIIYDGKNNIKEAYIYIISDSFEASVKQVICEHRYYKTEKDDNGQSINVPYQKFIVYSVRQSNNGTEVKELEEKDLSKEFLAKYGKIAFNTAKKLEYPSIGVYDIRYSKFNKKFFDSDIPEAMFTDAVDNAVVVDTSITGKEVDKEIGRGQILMPDPYQQDNMPYMNQMEAGTRVMRSLTVTYKDPTIKKYPSRSMEDSKPTNVQFDMRSTEWISGIDNDIARLCESVGVGIIDFCPRLLGGNQRTDDEINAMTDITANTVKAFRNINEAKINALLTDVATYFKLNVKVSIRWSMASILNPSKNTDLIIRQLGAGLISRKEAIRRANPDLNEKEVDDLYKEVVAEQGAMATENAFNNF